MLKSNRHYLAACAPHVNYYLSHFPALQFYKKWLRTFPRNYDQLQFLMFKDNALSTFTETTKCTAESSSFRGRVCKLQLQTSLDFSADFSWLREEKLKVHHSPKTLKLPYQTQIPTPFLSFLHRLIHTPKVTRKHNNSILQKKKIWKRNVVMKYIIFCTLWFNISYRIPEKVL